MNQLELIQYLFDTIEETEKQIVHVRARYPRGPIRDMKLAELNVRLRTDKHTINILTDSVVASVR